MSIECIHARELLSTAFALEGPVVRVQLLVSLAVVLSREALAAAGPVAAEWLLFVV